MTKILEVNNLTTRFFTRQGEVMAVNGISFAIHKGDTVGIVGESGCGKSVSMLSLLRLIKSPPGKIVSGEVNFQGRDLLKIKLEEMERVRGNKIGMVFQDPMTSLNPVMTVGRQIEEALKRHLQISNQQATRRTVELLEMTGISNAPERKSDYPHQFSGGMRQRAMIGMALACEPELLIADEPTTALDVTIQAQIIDLVKHLQELFGMAVLWITHDLGVVARLAKRVIVMYAGYIIEDASAKDLFKSPMHPYTIGLLHSLPKLNEITGTKLRPIPGQPPDLLNLPVGCPFSPRCSYRTKKCKEANPPLENFDHLRFNQDTNSDATNPPIQNHKVACWEIKRTGGAMSHVHIDV